MSQTFFTFFEETKEAVNTILEEYLLQDNVPSPLFEAMITSIQNGGKRLRPALTKACANLFQVPDAQSIRVGAAIELIHCYSLIHDDLPAMDNADMRRGKPSCWREFGEATAILAGDSLLPLAFEVLSDEATHPNALVRLNLIQCLAKDSGAKGMAGGQMLDLSPHLLTSMEKATHMQNLKTGCLIAFSCEAGAILAERPIEDRNRLRRFGTLLGLAYQIQDDLLDIEGNSDNLGKPVGMDSQKKSLIAFLSIEESKKYLQDLQQEMASLIAPYSQPFFHDLMTWVTTRQI